MIKLGIAAEPLLWGSIQTFTARLDESMRAVAPGDASVVSAPVNLARSFPGRRSAAPSHLREFLKAVQPIRWLVRLARRLGRPGWPEAKQWARNWREMPDDIICLLPTVTFFDNGELDAYYEAIAARKNVLVIHDLGGFHFPEQWEPHQLARMRRRFSALAQSALAVVVHNDFTASDVIDKLGVDPAKISVVRLPSLISTNAYAETRSTEESVLSKLGITRPYALWASSSTRSHKNHECLLRAWRILMDRGHQIDLVCTGSKSPRWKEVSASISEHGLEDCVKFTDVVEASELPVLVHNATLAVCPTLFEGGGAGPANEALLACVPAAASDIPQVRQCLHDREDWLSLFDPKSPEAIADSVEWILLNYQAAKDRAVRARDEYLAAQTWEMTASQYWQAVERAVSGGCGK